MENLCAFRRNMRKRARLLNYKFRGAPDLPIVSLKLYS